MPLVGVVHAVHEVRRPTGVSLDAHHLELRMALEYAGEDQHAHDVLAAANDGEKAVDLGPAWLAELVIAARRQNVPGERQLERYGGFPERIVDRIVVVLLRRVARHHHALEAHRLD